MASKYSIEATFRLIDRITAPLNRIEKKGNLVGDGLKSSFLKTEQQLANMGSKLKGSFKYAVGAGIGGLALATKQGVTNMLAMDTAMTKVSTIADTSVVPIKQLKSDLFNVSNLTGVAFTELAEAQYQAISGGIDTANSVKFVETAVKAAKGGFTDTTTAVDGLTSVLNAYQYGADKATVVSDQMLVAQNLGKTTFGEMAQNMGKVLPVAATLNVSTDSLFASIATLTNQAIPTSEAMTGMKAVLSNIIRPSEQAIKAAEKLGIAFDSASLKSMGLPAFLKQIGDATGGNTDVLAKLFGSTDAVKAVVALTGTGADKFNEALKAMGNTADATKNAFDKVQADRGAKFAMIGNKIQNVFAKLGEAIIPLVDKVMNKVSGFADRLMTFDFSTVLSPIIGFTNTVIGLVSVLWKMRAVIADLVIAWAIYKAAMVGAVVVGKIMGLVQAVTVLMSAQKGMNVVQAVFNVLLTANPIGLVVAGIAALVAIVIVCIKYWDNITAALSMAWEWFVKIASPIWDLIGIFTGPFGAVVSIVSELYNGWSKITEAFTNGGIIAGIKQIGATILAGLLKPIEAFLGVVAKIPGVGGLVQPALDKLESFRAKLVGLDPSVTVKHSGLTPVSSAQQLAYYSRRDSYEHAEISVRAEQGSSAKVTRRPKSPNFNLAVSGSASW